VALHKTFSIIVIASKDEKDFSLLKKLKDKFSGHEIILAIDIDNELSTDTLNNINLNILFFLFVGIKKLINLILLTYI